jgi:MoaA/NifB/PqqE/SkfB family radical SAM enzyme
MFANPWINKQLGQVSERLSLWLGRPLVWAPPRRVAIETANFCNLRCPMCKLGRRALGREIGAMDYDRYCGLIDELWPYVRRLSFPWYGEPFGHKHFGRFVRYASDKGMVVHILTNGTFLNEREIDYLVDCRVRAVGVAIDGLTQATYEQYRRGGDLAEVTAGVRRLVALRAERGSRYPERIEMKFLVMSHNEHEVDRVESFGRELGCDKVTIKTAHMDGTEEGKTLLPTGDKYRRYDEHNRLKSARDRAPGCQDLWRSAVISWDGAMGLCCVDSDCEYSPGNVFEDGFFKLWFGDKMQRFRRAVLRNKYRIPLCRNCVRG